MGLTIRSFFANTMAKLAGYNLLTDAGSWSLTGTATTGQNVNTASALTYSAVWAAVRVISEAVSSLPLQVFMKDSQGGRSKALGHPLYRILHDQPNPEMSSLTFRETLMGHVLTWGNGYAEIVRDKITGRVMELWPLDPSQVKIVRDNEGNLYYQYGTIIFLPAEILHIKGLAFDGVAGYSVIGMARNSIGLGMAVEDFGATFFGQGGKPAGVITVPGKLNSEAIQNMRKSWEEMHSTNKNAHRVAILQNGVAYQSIGTPPDDAQWIASRTFQIEEIARWFKIPPSKLGNGKGTYTNLEQDNLSFLQETLRPWLIRWEQEINFKLISSMDSMYAEHNQDALMRGDSQGRAAFYAQALNWGWLSRNDVRSMENLPPFEGGESYMIPKNMDPAFGPGSPAVAVDAAALANQLPASQTSPQDAPILATAPPAADVAATALNEAQISSLVDIVAKVGEGLLPLESAKAIAQASFPFLSQAVLDAIFSGIKVMISQPTPPQPQKNSEPELGFAGLLEAARVQIRKIEFIHLGRISLKPKDFIPALEKFLEAHEGRVETILEPVMEFIKPAAGGASRAASDHCQDLKNQWLEVAGNSNATNLKSNADEKLKDWMTTKTNWENISWLS
jgi:HK97 family phage portal protein